MRTGRFIRLVFAALALVAVVPGAGATTVLLVRPEHPGTTTAEALVRMHGELVAAGFDVQVLARSPGPDARASLESAAADFRADAVVGILGDAVGDAVEVWIVDKVTKKIVVRTVPSVPLSGHPSEVLAIRSLELLRASFLEVAMIPSQDAREAPMPAPVEVQRYVANAVNRRFGTVYALEAGAVVELGQGGLPPTVMPQLRFMRTFLATGFVRLSVAGLGSRAAVEGEQGSAQVWKETATIQIGRWWWKGGRVRPCVFLGGGVARTRGVGQAQWPYQGMSAHVFSGVVDGGVGLDVKVAGRFDLVFEAHARYLSPTPVVRFIDATLEAAGRPSFGLHVGVRTWM